ncbi:MAG: PDZ domain-containing protein [Phycisphaerales bacterium]|nr:PDZ domain-containing protein [Phycisphaerales bacterium]
MPRFSPDGTQIAFTGNYDGNTDLYVLPATGGLPQRVTYHPESEILLDWAPDGELIFSAWDYQGTARLPRLFTTSAEGGLPTPIPVPYGARASVSPDGRWLAYTPWSRDGRTWKRYRGGMATDLWLVDLQTGAARQITDWEGTDSHPMWHGDTLYYVSDAGPAHRMNIWQLDPATDERSQVTTFTDVDVHWPAMGPGPDGRGEIIMQTGSGLRLLDLATGGVDVVDVEIPGDRPTIRPRRVDVSGDLGAASLSPSGRRIAVEARGDVWSLPAENGAPRNLTQSNDAAERDPSWSPDGRWIAFFTDRSGEYELWLQQSDGREPARQITTAGGPFKRSLAWSPGSDRFVFSDKTGTVFLHEIDQGTTPIYQDPIAESGGVAWSHDGRWLTYRRHEDDTLHGSIWVYDTETGTPHRLTSGMFNDNDPVFDRDGDFLYFSSNRTFSPVYSSIDDTFAYIDAQGLFMAPLRNDVESPWIPEVDEERWDEEELDEDDGDPIAGDWFGVIMTDEVEQDASLELQRNDDGALVGSWFTGEGDTGRDVTAVLDEDTGELTIAWDEENLTLALAEDMLTSEVDGTIIELERLPATIEIDVKDFESRVMPLPVMPGEYSQLAIAGDGRLLFMNDNEGMIHAIDTHDRDAEPEPLFAADGFSLSPDGDTMLLMSDWTLSTASLAEGTDPAPVPTEGMVVVIDPREEWNQMFDDVWRIFRDYFYLENMHGVDWIAIREQYRPMLADCATREDVNYVIGEMIAELNVGHAYRWGGDGEEEKYEPVGVLGVDFEIADGHYRLATIHHGAPWDTDARGPLGEPGIDVHEGDYLLAVNGNTVDVDLDPYAALMGTAGQPTTLTVSAFPTWDDRARDVVVEPAYDDAYLRYRAWVEANRLIVEEATDGRVGYVYVPDTGVNGQNELFRQFFGQAGRDALIIDERFNGGGQIPWRFIELLDRPVSNYWAVRDGRDWKTPDPSHQGPKCMLINGLAGSGGDMFPWLFRRAELGPIIGERTWGGLVGISGNPRLVDGGRVAVPTFGFYETDGTWGVEGHGVDPDIEVVAHPEIMMAGTDPQLQRAIEEMLAALEQTPPTKPRRPASPDRRGMGIPQEDR